MQTLGCSQAVRQWTLTPSFRGFKSFHPNQYESALRHLPGAFLFFWFFHRLQYFQKIHKKIEKILDKFPKLWYTV